MTARKDGSGSQTSNAACGKTSVRGLEAPERVGHEPAAFEEVAGDADVVGGVLRLRKDDRGGDERPDDERQSEEQEGRDDGLATGAERRSGRHHAVRLEDVRGSRYRSEGVRTAGAAYHRVPAPTLVRMGQGWYERATLGGPRIRCRGEPRT